MDQDPSSRTIFLLDSSRDLSQRPGQTYEINDRERTIKISKSLYTLKTESVSEFSRIIYDLFPNGEKLLSVISCQPMSTTILNNWNSSEQNCENIVNSFVKLTKESANKKAVKSDISKSFLFDGFKQALVHLSSNRKSSISKNKMNNAGRIIVITYFIKETFVSDFKNRILQELTNYNKKTETIICKLDVILINNYPPFSEQTVMKVIPKENLSDKLSFSFISVENNSTIAAKLTSILYDAYDLVSTTVCNIPMKEEQNSGSSANYDVEIIHSRKAHNKFFDYTNCDDISSFYQDVKHFGENFKSLRLKWLTPPKNNSLDNYYCPGVYRITAVDVSSRPTSCLINFLHSGKTVLLELPRKSISHWLSCHNGELYIHVLIPKRPLIEDAASISEGVGGRITDYRINDFAILMKKNHLVKCSQENGPINNELQQAESALKKQTMYWPISLGFTVIYNTNSNQLQDFCQIYSKPTLTDEDLTILRNTIFEVLRDSQSNSLPIQSNIIRYKSLKKEDLYRILWNEMEHIMHCYNVSPNHQSILQTYLDVKPKTDSNYPFQMIHNNNHNHNNMEESNNGDYYSTNIKYQHHHLKINYNRIKTSSESLKDIFVANLEAKRKKPNFVGAIKKIKLYESFHEDN